MNTLNYLTLDEINQMTLSQFVDYINSKGWSFHTAPSVVFGKHRHDGFFFFYYNDKPAKASTLNTYDAERMANGGF